MNIQRIERVLEKQPISSFLYFDIPRHELFVEKIDSSTWHFTLGVLRDIPPIEFEDMDEDEPFFFQLPKHPIHHNLSEPIVAPSTKKARELLDSFINQELCQECHTHYTGYSPYKSLCGNCFLKMPSIEMKDKCPVCLKEGTDMIDIYVVKCDQCQALICHECFVKMNPIHDKEKHTFQRRCPVCRDANKFNKKYIVET